MTLPYEFTRHGRSRATLFAVTGVWLGCLLGVLILSFAAWIIVIVLLFTLPALWDLYSGRTAGLQLNEERLRWYSGAREAEVSLHEIDHARLVTRLDLTVRVALVLNTGSKLRLPAEATPPGAELEAALTAAGVKVQRHHFTTL